VLLIPRILIEHKAGQIVDPVERLRYLQRNSAIAQRGAPRISWRQHRLPAIALALLLGGLLAPGYKASRVAPVLSLGSLRRVSAAGPEATWPNVWLVDKSNDFETYSNGLRIDDRYVSPNDKRVLYPVYQLGAADSDEPELRSQPAGIVYHTTESDQARFSEEENARLKRIGKAVVGVVQQNHSYHFLIDRFGQVFRIVPESDIANHAGYSVWADSTGIYVNLNASFLGVAFETQTQHGEQPSATPAQIHAARVLTEMLRNKYHIPQSDCVTHAQVSVNPDNMLIGYHTDWAGNFPFLALGLNDNYSAPPPSIYAFGFDYDPTFVHATGVRLWQGLALAEDQVQTQAASRGLPVPQYRAVLQKKYKEILAALKRAAASDKKNET
jgi:N-acetylmuramoyl-L-alanine amidase